LPDNIETLEGTVERIVYRAAGEGFAIFRLRTEDGRLVSCAGNPGPIGRGQRLRVAGRWERHEKFGPQMRIVSAEIVIPETTDGLVRMLGSGLIPGVGPKLAGRIVERFGAQALKVLTEEPGRLTEVSGIGRKKAEGIIAFWRDRRAEGEALAFLAGLGLGPLQSAAVAKLYGTATKGAVGGNPYRMAGEVSGIGFKTADAAARRLGFAADSPQRARAAVEHVLVQASDEGHSYLPREVLRRRAAEGLDVGAEAFDAAILEAQAEGRLVIEGDSVYLRSLAEAERELAEALAGLLGGAPSGASINVERALAWFRKKTSLALSKGQADVVRGVVGNRLAVVTGGPGVGKTTAIRALIEIFEAKGTAVALAAPTGRAARRMADSTGREARTIHRLLGYNPRTESFAFGPENPLPAELVIIDETSMVDIFLARNLLRALSPTARLVLVGDADQLPSVGPGSVLRELVASNLAPIVRLVNIFRQAAGSRIVSNAHRINSGHAIELADASEESDFHFIEEADPKKIVSILLGLMTRRLSERFGLDPARDVQVISPMHRGPLGTDGLNLLLQKTLNPASRDAIEVAGRRLAPGDKVLQTRNNYDKDVFNGDIGRIVSMDAAAGSAVVEFDGRRIGYAFANLGELAPAYCITVHKSQGSEYPAVVLILSSEHHVMLQRSLLYTAVTRARRLAVVIGTRRAMETAIRNDRPARRYTALAAKMAAKRS